MKEKPRRFECLEHFPTGKIVRKDRICLDRFKHLEVSGHKIKVEVQTPTKRIKIEGIICPLCYRRNPPDADRCLSCGQAFEKRAPVETKEKRPEEERQKTDGGTKAESWQVRCPGCGRLVNRRQANCLYCGWRIAPIKSGPQSTQSEETYSQTQMVTLDIDGNTYRSTDKHLPPHIRALMVKIAQEGYSQEVVDRWISARNMEMEFEHRRIEDRISNLRWRVVWSLIRFAAALIPIAFFIYFYHWRLNVF